MLVRRPIGPPSRGLARSGFARWNVGEVDRETAYFGAKNSTGMLSGSRPVTAQP